MRKYKLTAVSTWNWPPRCIYLIIGWPQKVWKGVTRNIWIQIYSSYGHCKLVRQGMLLLHSATTVIGPCVWGTLLWTESAMLCSSRCTHWTFPTNCGDWKYVPGHHTPFFQTSRSDQLQQNCSFWGTYIPSLSMTFGNSFEGKGPLGGKGFNEIAFFQRKKSLQSNICIEWTAINHNELEYPITSIICQTRVGTDTQK